MPLTAESRKRFTEIVEPSHLDDLSVIDFVPGHEPYEHRAGEGTHLVMRVEPLHDDI